MTEPAGRRCVFGKIKTLTCTLPQWYNNKIAFTGISNICSGCVNILREINLYKLHFQVLAKQQCHSVCLLHIRIIVVTMLFSPFVCEQLYTPTTGQSFMTVCWSEPKSWTCLCWFLVHWSFAVCSPNIGQRWRQSTTLLIVTLVKDGLFPLAVQVNFLKHPTLLPDVDVALKFRPEIQGSQMNPRGDWDWHL